MTELGADDPVDAFIRIRLRIYDEIVSNAEVMRQAELPHTVALARTLRAERYPLGLTTQSDCKRTLQLMDILGLPDAFDVGDMVTGDEVIRGKPDPQIYQYLYRQAGRAAAAMPRPGGCGGRRQGGARGGRLVRRGADRPHPGRH